MNCVTGPSMNVLWNGEKTEPFTPSRGLRQGDPLSPYLFVLCLERLCHQIEFSVAAKDWKPISLSRGGPKLSHVCFADDLILFAEASVAQVKVIRKVLEKFCLSSGQKVSLEKSKIYFSENVSRELAALISNESGIQATRELGKYLGMPVLQKRINKDTFGEVVERVSSKLAGWKGRFLSMAGRITLTKSVLSSIPVHTMSTIALPQATIATLDKLARDFIWGSDTNQRRQHLLSWEKICMPKKEGGLGIRRPAETNKALLAKLGWRFLRDNDSIWAKVLRKKYRVENVHDPSWLKVKGTWSSTWRSVCLGLRDVVIPELTWVIGDGRDIRFWSDKWLGTCSLMELSTSVIPNNFSMVSAREMWANGTGWNFQRIMGYVPDQVRLKLLSVVLDDVTGAKDRISWGHNADGNFSVRSAYELLIRKKMPRPNVGKLFEKVWKVVAPERVKVFLWLGMNQVIMTNMERQRRHLSNTGVCQVCRGGEETILHVLRDCPAISGVWNRIIPQSKRREFFTQSLLEWLYVNLGDEGCVRGSVWSTIFALTTWWGWKWRCMNVFETPGRCRDRVRFIVELAQEVTRAHDRLQAGNGRLIVREQRLVRWLPPQTDWMKLNTDGASHGNPGQATAGGVMRDSEGRWCGGFAVHIGICSAPLAELWGVYYGLYIAWENGARRLVLEVDSEIVVGFLTTGISDSHPLSFLTRLCYGFLSKDWIVRIVHVYREANRLADGLANYAFSLPLGFHLFTTMPDCVGSIMSEDNNGPGSLRNVRL